MTQFLLIKIRENELPNAVCPDCGAKLFFHEKDRISLSTFHVVCSKCHWQDLVIPLQEGL